MTTATLAQTLQPIEIYKHFKIWMNALKDAILDEMLVQRTIAELKALNDRELEDIMISRADIVDLARGRIQR